MTCWRVTIALLALGWLASTHNHAAAQDFQTLYARGVQAYFSGGSPRAEGLLTEALMHNPRDPRAYYFRGLARLRSGRRYEAEQDFRVGAAMEAAWAGRPIAMGRTLERVQGGDRIVLERIRREARQNYDATQAVNLEQRYQRTTDRGQEVIRTEFRLPLSTLTAGQGPDDLARMVAAQATAAGDPFADDPVERVATPIDIPDAARGAVTLEEMGGLVGRLLGRILPVAPSFPGGPSAAPGAGDEDPFGAPAAADSTDSSDPFGAAPAEDPFGAPAADPFGTPADDPFGTPGDDPFSAPAGDDPFGGDPFGN